MGDSYLGQIALFGFDYAPEGWMKCDGSLLPIQRNTALYTLLGDQHGGDRKTTFRLPDLTGKEPIPGTYYAICVKGAYPPRP